MIQISSDDGVAEDARIGGCHARMGLVDGAAQAFLEKCSRRREDSG